MDIERYEGTGLKLIYKYIFICKKCERKYGQDTSNPRNILCPFCERESFNSGVIKKNKEEESNINLKKEKI